MDIYLHKFSKRDNSTSQPTGTGTKYSVTLKEPTEVSSPVFTITGNSFTDYNYAYIPDFGRYYFISDIVTNNMNITQMQLQEDYLASWKTAIGNTVAHILRCETGYDKDIMDSNCAVKTTVQVDSNFKSLTTPTFSNTGCYILSVAGNSQASNENGFITSYILTRSDIQQIAAALFACPLPDLNNYQNYLLKSLRSPLEAIISCTWIPIDYTWLTNQNPTKVSVVAGDYDLGVGTKHVLTGSVFTITDTISCIPRYNDFRAIEPYTNYRLFVPMCGTVDISAKEFREPLSLGGLPFTFTIDVAAATISILLYQGGGKLQTIQTNIGVDCPIAQTSRDMAGYTNSVIDIGVGATNIANNPASIVGMLSSGASMVMSGLSKTTSVKGSLQGRDAANMGIALTLTEITMDTANPTAANYLHMNGRPLEKSELISNHSGYILCSNASVVGEMLSNERAAINGYLNSGFYYE